MKTEIRESLIELIDGDPGSAIAYYVKCRRVSALARAAIFTVMTHITLGTYGAIDIPWGSSSAFGIPHYRGMRKELIDSRKDKGESLINSYISKFDRG